jgi:hypothetical protein
MPVPLPVTAAVFNEVIGPQRQGFACRIRPVVDFIQKHIGLISPPKVVTVRRAFTAPNPCCFNDTGGSCDGFIHVYDDFFHTIPLAKGAFLCYNITVFLKFVNKTLLLERQVK